MSRPRHQTARDIKRFPDADHELSNEEIEAAYGDVIREAVAAIKVDYRYTVEMMEAASRIAEIRAKTAADAAARQERRREYDRTRSRARRKARRETATRERAAM